jgi:hypothetical protein
LTIYIYIRMPRLGHKQHHQSSWLKGAEDVGDTLGKIGGGLATAGAISSATGVGVAVGAPAAAMGAITAAAGGVIGGGARLIESIGGGDLESGIDATGEFLGGLLGFR